MGGPAAMEAAASSSSSSNPPLPLRALRAIRLRRRKRQDLLPQSMALTAALMLSAAYMAERGVFEGWREPAPARAVADLHQGLSYVPGGAALTGAALGSPADHRRQLYQMDSDIVAWTPYGYVNLSSITCPAIKKNTSSTFPSLGDDFENGSGRAGATFFIIVVTLYMFLGLAIVCDSFFEASLSAICEAMNLKDDVAGATWMAAGGSAPELATSIIGVFISRSDVGFGTIVGSAVFNVLFVIACCAFVAPNLSLTWWPLARDCSYYCFALAMIVIFVSDLKVEHWEAVILLLMYVGYVVEMYFNEALEKWVTKRIDICQKWGGITPLKKFIESVPFAVLLYSAIVANAVFSILEIDQFNKESAALPCVCTESDEGLGGFNLGADALGRTTYGIINMVFNGVFILEMLFKWGVYGFFGYWKIPLNCFDGALVFLIIIEVILMESARGDPATGDPTQDANDAIGVGVARMLRLLKFVRVIRTFRLGRGIFRLGAFAMKTAPTDQEGAEDDGAKTRTATENGEKPAKDEKQEEEEEEEDDEPFNPFEVWGDFTSFGGICGRLFWLIGLPLSVSFWLTIPDCRRPMFAKCWFGTFIMCIAWIGGLSCVMVWMVERFGIMYGIPESIMGLYVLAAGTSIPDCLSSVAVARRGHGDMAVSSSIGSNIFDVLIGLPVPWFIYTAIMRPALGPDYGPTYVEVNSEALAVMILMLFVMVALVITTIHISGWILSVKLGGAMMTLYLLFLILSAMLDRGVIFPPCTIVDPLIGG